jgi:hypothetical protein
MSEQDPIEARLERLARATEGVTARPDFTARVISRLPRNPVGWWSDLPKIARRVVPVAALVAAASVAWAVRSSFDADEALTDSYDVTEIEW